jgi:hypothetical protein
VLESKLFEGSSQSIPKLTLVSEIMSKTIYFSKPEGLYFYIYERVPELIQVYLVDSFLTQFSLYFS